MYMRASAKEREALNFCICVWLDYTDYLNSLPLDV